MVLFIRPVRFIAVRAMVGALVNRWHIEAAKRAGTVMVLVVRAVRFVAVRGMVGAVAVVRLCRCCAVSHIIAT